MRTLSRLLPLTALTALTALNACGAPGADDVFTKGNPKIAAPDSARPAPAQPPRIQPKRISGYYRRLGEESQFRPCGTNDLLDIIGTPDGRFRLQEAFRWNSVWQGRKMFGILQGAIVTDTPRTTGAKGDTAAPVPRTRFFIMGVDSLRTWQASDCGGMRIP